MVVDILSENEEKWVNFIMKFELDLQNPILIMPEILPLRLDCLHD